MNLSTPLNNVNYTKLKNVVQQQQKTIFQLMNCKEFFFLRKNWQSLRRKNGKRERMEKKRNDLCTLNEHNRLPRATFNVCRTFVRFYSVKIVFIARCIIAKTILELIKNVESTKL